MGPVESRTLFDRALGQGGLSREFDPKWDKVMFDTAVGVPPTLQTEPVLTFPPRGGGLARRWAMTDWELPERGIVFWPVGKADSVTIAVDADTVIQIDIYQPDSASDEEDDRAPCGCRKLVWAC